MRVLIVDDNEAMRRTIKTVIQDLVDEIVECSSGAAALKTLRDFPTRLGPDGHPDERH